MTGNKTIKKIIKIFLASSSELKDDREQFEIFINRKNKEYIKKGIFLELVMWEDFLDAMSPTRLQDEYNKAVADCDIFVSLFHTKVGKYTEEEFEKAFKTFKANDKPLIYTYFNQEKVEITPEIVGVINFQKKLSDLGHFWTKYDGIKDLKFQFGEQLVKILPDSNNLCPEDIFGVSGINPQSAESSILSQAWDELVTIIDSIDDLKLIKNIVRLSLPNEVINKRPEIIDIQDVGSLRQIFLDDYRKRNDGMPRIIDFAHCLYCEPKIKEHLKTKLNSWLEEITQKLAITRPGDPKKQDLQSSEFFLLVVARHESDQFRLVAELHPDPAQRLPSLPIDLQEDERGSECSFKKIPGVNYPLMRGEN